MMSVSPGLGESAFLSQLCQRLLVALWYRIHKMYETGNYQKSPEELSLFWVGKKPNSYCGTYKVYKRYLRFLKTLQTLTRMWLFQRTEGAASNLFCQEKMLLGIIALTGRTTGRTKVIKWSSSSAGEGWLSARQTSSLKQKMGSVLSLSYLPDDKAKLDGNKCNQSPSFRLQDKTQGTSLPQWLILFFSFLMRIKPVHPDFLQRNGIGESMWWGRKEPAINVE